jgi:hypothetical protein
MKRFRRWLSNAVAAISLLLFAATVFIWMRSYFVADCFNQIDAPRTFAEPGWPDSSTERDITSARGGLGVKVFHLDYRSANQPYGPSPFQWSTDAPTAYPSFSPWWNDPRQTWRHYCLLGFEIDSVQWTPEARQEIGPVMQENYATFMARSVPDPNAPIMRERSYFLLIPYWSLAALTAAIPLTKLISFVRHRRCKGPGLCPTCGYDLRATPEKCPECGKTIETPSNSHPSRSDVRQAGDVPL